MNSPVRYAQPSPQPMPSQTTPSHYRKMPRLEQAVCLMTKRDFLASWQAAQGEDRNTLLRARFRHNADEFLKYCLPVVFSGPWNPYHLAVLDNTLGTRLRCA